jgi:aminoglycoside/choline kinase family phosphotransferase
MKSNSEHPQAIELVDEPERRMRARMDEQFATLKQNARALFRALKGYPRANDLEAWKKIYQVAKADYDSGSFLIEKLGARRFLEVREMAVLVQLRQELLADIHSPATADKMAADTAIISYYDILRLQEWIGNLALVVERHGFGQEALSEIHGPQLGEKLSADLYRLEDQIFPLIDRAHRMMMRSLAYLDGRDRGPPSGSVRVDRAAQVNVGGVVTNTPNNGL